MVAEPTPTPHPLVVGSILLDCYTIVEILSADSDVNVYRVAEMRRCPNCGVDNEGRLTHCGFCKAELPAARTLMLSERAAPPNGQIIPSSFILSGLNYAFAHDVDHADAPQQAAVQITYGYVTDPGLLRGTRGDPNEDSVLAFQLSAQHSGATQTIGLFVVADGVGGAEAGEVASQMAIRHMAHELLSTLTVPNGDAPTQGAVQQAIRDAFARTNAQIVDYAVLHDVPLGSTMTLALVLDNRIYFANVGDSRSYLYRDKELLQITQDHSYVAQLVARGEITDEEARNHPQRNLILRSLGDASGFEFDIFPEEGAGMELVAGDQVLVCSDGLWEMLDDQEIAGVLADAPDPQHACVELASSANAAGGTDNISAIVLKVHSAHA